MTNDNEHWYTHIKLNLSLFVLRLLGFWLAAEIFSFVVLGIAFGLIAQGVFFGVLALALVWEPAQTLLARITGTEFPLPLLTKPRFMWLFVFHTLLGMAMAAFLIGGGFLIFLQGGFCGQNFICLFLR